MRSMSLLNSCAPRWSTQRTPSRKTYGPAVAALAAQWGHDLMPWQRHVLDTALELLPNGELAYRLVTVTVPRQSGKSSLLLPLAVHRCVAWGSPQRVVYAAQHRNAARSKLLEDWRPLLAQAPGLGAISKVMAGKGDEKVEWSNGSYFELSASTEIAGHGKTVDLAIVDEAFALSDNRLEQAFKPAMITRQSPQLWVVSTAGTDAAVYLNAKVDAGRQAVADGVTESVAYFEWSAEDGADASDPKVWAGCMPALGFTVDESAIKADSLTMDTGEFRRAYLNRWTPGVASPPVPLAAWAACGDEDVTPDGRLVYGVDIAPNRRSASVYVCDDDLRMELVHHCVDDMSVAALGAWLVRSVGQHDVARVCLDASGPAGSLVSELAAAGVAAHTVSGRELGHACAEFYDAVTARRVRHRPSGLTATALGAATKRSLGDLWLWNRSNAIADITPAVAATLALHGASAPDTDTGSPVFAY